MQKLILRTENIKREILEIKYCKKGIQIWIRRKCGLKIKGLTLFILK